MNHKNSRYPLQLKVAVSLGQERELYSPEEIKKIPRSTLSEWRKRSPDFFYNQILSGEKRRELLNVFNAQVANRDREKELLENYMSFIDFIKSSMGHKAFDKFLMKHRAEFVKHVESIPRVVSRRRFLEVTNISASRFSAWEFEANTFCLKGVDNVCVKKRPLQLTQKERDYVRRVVEKGGPNKFAIWATNFKEGKIKFSLSSFYKYSKGFQTEHQRRKAKIHPNKVRAERLHEIWHADITIIKTLDGSKHYLYCIIDNFSRAILAWRLADRISEQISVSVLQEAFVSCNPIQPLKMTSDGNKKRALLKYMTDGGAENKKIEAKVVFSISHLVAWKNIRSSNSMIERVFHTMKNEYKYILYAEDATELNALLMQTIDAYMDRPHSQLGIYTPREVVMKRDGWFDERRALKDGAEKRLRTNQNSRCINCSCKGMSSCLREGA